MITMHLAETPFNQIKSGRKTTEIRLNDKKRQELKIGDIIEFMNIEETEAIKAKVTNLTHAPDFAALYSITDFVAGGWEPNATQDDYHNFMSQFYSEEEQAQLGVVEISFDLILNDLPLSLF
jgi:ASC-1-like (ASCH) protein